MGRRKGWFLSADSGEQTSTSSRGPRNSRSFIDERLRRPTFSPVWESTIVWRASSVGPWSRQASVERNAHDSQVSESGDRNQDREPKRMIGEPIQVDFRKWPDKKHWQYLMEHIGDDEHGRWLWAPAGNIAYRGEEGPLFLPSASVKVITDDWWAANFLLSSDGSTSIYVDIIKPATWGDRRVTMVDLDLDISTRSTGEVVLLDEDEFIENQRLLQYPAELVTGAEAAARRIYEDVVTGREPFGQVGWRWLSDAIATYERRTR